MKKIIAITGSVLGAVAIGLLLGSLFSGIFNSRSISVFFEDLVPDSVILAAFERYGRGDIMESPADVRREVFATWMCPKYLELKELAPTEFFGDTCEELVFASYSASKEERESMFENYFPGRFTPATQREISGVRSEIMQWIQNYLLDPERLQEAYKKKKEVIIRGFYILSEMRKKDFVRDVKFFLRGMKLSRDVTARSLAVLFQIAKENEGRTRHLWGENIAEGTIAYSEDLFTRSLGGESWMERNLTAKGLEFALRREKEHGGDLVDVYVRIANDFLKEIE